MSAAPRRRGSLPTQRRVDPKPSWDPSSTRRAVRLTAYRQGVLHVATVLGLKVTNSMTAGDALVAAGTFILAVFAALSVFEALGAIEESRNIDRLNARRAAYRRSREIRGVARLIHQELIINRDIAEDALHAGQWPISSGTTHHAWGTSAGLIMEELDEDIAAKLVAVFSEVVRWETFAADAARRSPNSYSTPVTTGSVAFEVAERVGQLAPDCMKSLRALAYPDARDAPSDPDTELEYRERQRRRRWYYLWLVRR
jgi:hypothetical protein